MSPRPTSLISAEHSWLTETCGKPSARAIPADHALVRGMRPGVHEDDGDGLEVLLAQRRERGPHGVLVRRLFDRSVGQHALVDLDHFGVKLARLDDLFGEDFRARLIADLQRVAETARGDQRHALAGALQQRVGGDRRAHLDEADGAFGDRRVRGEPQQIANPLHGGVLVGGTLGDELAGVQRALGVAADHVGESAAAIDPEIPALRLDGHLNSFAPMPPWRARKLELCSTVLAGLVPVLHAVKRKRIGRKVLALPGRPESGGLPTAWRTGTSPAKTRLAAYTNRTHRDATENVYGLCPLRQDRPEGFAALPRLHDLWLDKMARLGAGGGSRAAVPREALERGINFFDTADVYSLGASEEIVGRALKALRQARTKSSSPPRCTARWGRAPIRRPVAQAHHGRDRRLAEAAGMDYVDLYQIHRFDPATPIEETLEALNDVVSAGKARYVGASSMYAWQFAKMLAISRARGSRGFVSMQNFYNLVYREEEREMMPLCASEGIGVIPWSPMARGYLAGAGVGANAATVRGRTDPFSVALGLGSPQDEAIRLKVVEVARDLGSKPAVVALAWVLSKPFVTAPIIGASKPHHLEDAVAALKLKLDAETIAKLEAPYKPKAVVGH